ncbi:hypothetical protein ACFQ0B_10320 [Nonomuraea thailandensis]
MHEGERVRLSVENALAGRGRRVELPGAGAGLIGMRERASLVGGFFDAGEVWDGERARGGEGRWRVQAVLPTAG